MSTVSSDTRALVPFRLPVDQPHSLVFGPGDVVRYTVVKRPFSTEADKGELPAGLTILDLLERTVEDPALARQCRVWIGDQEVERHHWGRVRPKGGQHVVARVVPGKSKGKNPLRLILTLVVVVAAAVLAPYLAPALAVALGASVGVATALIGGVIIAAGTLLINMIAPVKPPSLDKLSNSNSGSSKTYSVEGTHNALSPYGVVPRVLGKHRMFPPLAALPFTEVSGDDQYLRMLVCWGYGPVDIAALHIGDTPITEYEDVETQTVYGYPDDDVITLYPQDVFEEGLTFDIVGPIASPASPYIEVTHVSRPDADELSVDVTYPIGTAFVDTSGDKRPYPIDIQVYYRLFGSTGAYTLAGTISTNRYFVSTYRRALRWATPVRAQYEVKLRRTSDSQNELNGPPRNFEQTIWTALRTFTNRDPVNLAGVALTAVRIRANKQLNGVIDTLNAVVTSIAPSWVEAGPAWVEQATQWPGDLFRTVLQGGGMARPIPDARVDLEGLAAFTNYCIAHGFKFNQVRDFQSSVWDALTDIAAAGRSSPTYRDGKWSVVTDQPQSTVVQHFTPRNSWGFAGQILYTDMPHGWRIRFVNELASYKQDERIVYDDGFTELNASKFEGIELPGITDPDLIHLHGRFHIAQARLRPQRYSFSADVEHLICMRGDLVAVSHDVPAWGFSYGRVKTRTINDDGLVSGLVLDDAVPMEDIQSYALRARLADGRQFSYNLVTDAGAQLSVSFSTPVATADAPNAGDTFSAGIVGHEVVLGLVLSIEPGPNLSAKITLVDYSPAIYTADSGTIPPFDSQVSTQAGNAYPIMAYLRSDESVMVEMSDGSLQPRLEINFGLVSYRGSSISKVELQQRLNGEDDTAWSTAGVFDQMARTVSISTVVEGITYDLRARYLLQNGSSGVWSPVQTHLVTGKTNHPPKVPVFKIDGNQLVWQWTADTPRPRDHDGYYLRFIHGLTVLTDPWQVGQEMHTGVWADSPFPLGERRSGKLTFMLKAVDKSRLESDTPSIIYYDFGDGAEEGALAFYDVRAAGFELFGDTAVFDGSNDYLLRGADLTANADGRKGTFYCVFNLNGGDGAAQVLMENTGGFVSVSRNSANKLVVNVQNSAATSSLSYVSTSTILAAGGRLQLLVSWDTDFSAGNKKLHVYVNGVAFAGTVTDAQAAFDIDYTRANWAVGATVAGASKLNASVDELFFSNDTYIDLTVPANLALFITSSGLRVFLGSTGDKPFGVAPILYLYPAASAAGSTFATNHGTGGDLSVTGALTTSAGTEAVPYTGAVIDTGDLEADEEADLFWGSDTSPFWGDDADPFWVGSFKAIAFTFRYTPSAEAATTTGAALSLLVNATDPNLIIEVRNPDAVDGRETFVPWLGTTSNVLNEPYEWRITTPASLKQARITQLQVVVTQPLIEELLEDVTISSAGTTRLPITKSYARIVKVDFTVQDTGTGATNVRIFDKQTTIGLGPLSKAFNFADVLVNALVDAKVVGVAT